MGLRGYLTFLLVINVSLSGLSQSKKYQKDKKLADQLFEQEVYMDALPYYQKLDTVYDNDGEISYKIGVCYIHSPYEVKSLPYFERAEKTTYRCDEFEYYFGRADHLNHLFDEAIRHYTNHINALGDREIDEKFTAESVKKLIKQCEYGKELVANKYELTITNLGPVVNSEYPEYVPVVSADESVLIFTARHPSTTGGKRDYDDGLFHEDIYVSYNENGTWTTPKNISENINTKNHDACIGLSPDGQQLFIYKSDPKSKSISGDIWVSHLDGNEWGAPIKLGDNVNTDKSWEPSASITADHKTLYFTSDREGGYGGTDIYVSHLDDEGHWGEAINMGPVINTPEDEDAPFIHVTGETFYFSSKGHNTMGGYDVFISELNTKDSTWGKPINAGYPINTASDDIYFVWSADGSKGYFASFREDTYGEKDLYLVTRPTTDPKLIVFKGFITDKNTKKAMAATITVTDLETNEVTAVYNSNAITGKYYIILPHGKDYNVTVEDENHLFYSEHFNVPEEVHYTEIRKNIEIDPIFATQPKNTKDSLEEPEFIYGSHMVLNNIFFDFDSDKLRPKSKTELDNLYELLTSYPSMYVELSGHTDDKGSNHYNIVLSEKRAMAVVRYLADKGIDHHRMIAVGYGEEKPLTNNSTDSSRQLNRRTELKIISKDKIKDYPKRVLAHNKHAMKTVTTLPKETTEYIYSSSMPKPEPGQILNLKVHFMYDNFDYITKFSQGRMQKLIALMNKYPEMRLRIHAHADPFGSDIYNQTLSERRAETVFNYLIENGLDKGRLEISTYGEEMPLVTSESIAKNLKNRRVEFEVLP